MNKQLGEQRRVSALHVGVCLGRPPTPAAKGVAAALRAEGLAQTNGRA